jgi:uncharacterized protein
VTTPGSLAAGSIEGRIAEELGVRERQVRAAVELLDGGSTVPFIARYRKEATEMLDDAQLRTLEERLRYLRELEERRTAILDSVREQGKLTEELEARIRGAETKARLEDIYLPFKPKRRTMAQIAREAGISKALLYHYFPSKEEFFKAALAEAAAELAQRTAPDESLPPLEQVRASTTAFVDWIEHRDRDADAVTEQLVGSLTALLAAA